jgi:hypothetical protein
VENATDTEEEQATDTGVASDTSTDNDTGSGPDDVNLAECITPSACDGKRVEITTTAIWSGSDYSADYRCVLALLRTAAAGELAPTTLALSAGAFGDSPTQYNVALGYAQPEAGLQALYFPNGGQSSADPTVRCTLAGTEIYQDCLDNPSLNCIGKDALFPSCAPDVMVCP